MILVSNRHMSTTRLTGESALAYIMFLPLVLFAYFIIHVLKLLRCGCTCNGNSNVCKL